MGLQMSQLTHTQEEIRMSKKTKNSKVKDGNTVSVHYVGTLDDGTEFDNSRHREEALSVKVGSGQLISGFDAALTGMKIGEVKNVQLAPEEAYGDVVTEAYQTVPHVAFPENFEFKVGGMVQGQDSAGQAMAARIDSVGDESVVLDFNHPLAGKTLNFEIELLSIDSSSRGS